MRILIVDHYYDAVVRWIYGQQPGLTTESYATQRAQINEALFGQTAFETAALLGLGHEASDSLVNIRPLQEAWSREHDMPLRSASTWGFSRRRRWIPWPRRGDDAWMADALLSQVRFLKPDVVHIQSMDLLHPELVGSIRDHARIVVGQIAADLPSQWQYKNYDFVVSSVPELVDRFRSDGADAELLPLAFEPSLLARIPEVDRTVEVSFVGSFAASHETRIEVLEAVARTASLQTWTADVGALPEGSPIRSTVQGTAWGRAMYEVLRRSRVTVNNHARIAGTGANNLRLFEATGMGAMLVTEARSNLGDLFAAGEVVTYRDPRECAELVRYYVDHPDEGAAIARAGQLRTLRDHTWADRMGRLVDMIRHRI